MAVQKQTPTRKSFVDTALLDPEHYTESLLSAANTCGYFTDADIQNIERCILNLLASRLAAWNGQKSCSVRTEIAQLQLADLLYVFDVRLMAEPYPDDAAVLLKQTAESGDLTALYQAGINRIKRKYAACVMQYQRMRPLFEKLPPSVFRTTAIDGLPAFFRNYQPDLWASEIHITADYPQYVPTGTDRRGISFIAAYLQDMADEAVFLSRFRPETLRAILCVGRRTEQNSDGDLGQITPDNLFRPLFANAVGMVLLGKPFSAWKTGLSLCDIRILAQKTYTVSEIADAAGRVIDLLMLPRSCASYCEKAVPKLTREINSAIRHDMPALIFPCPENHCVTAAEAYHGERMTADAYRCLVYDLHACDTPKARAALILDRVKGMEDLYDLLSSDEIRESDIRFLLPQLPKEAHLWLKQSLICAQPLQTEEERRLFRLLSFPPCAEDPPVDMPLPL